MEKPVSDNIKMPMPTAMQIIIVSALPPSPDKNRFVISLGHLGTISPKCTSLRMIVILL
jgi:hypothetical protein